MTVPHVVYHIACMGNWRQVITEQFALLRECGLADELKAIGDTVGVTHLGPRETLDSVLLTAAAFDVPVRIVKSDPNTDHYETLAMLEIEWLAKSALASRPILYMHTKGVSNPADPNKGKWRKVMEHYTVRLWRENVGHLESGRDACGFNWWNHGEQHFSGTFWIAKADWIRRLPSFVQYHNAKNRVRYTCELWIGAAQYCNAYSHGCMNAITWASDFPFEKYLPKEYPIPVVEPRPSATGNTVTFYSACTGRYDDDLATLKKSFVGVPHPAWFVNLHEPGSRPWRHANKLKFFKFCLDNVTTDYVFWIDADCELVGQIDAADLIGKGTRITAVRHFLYSKPQDGIPERLWPRLPEQTVDLYWQACLWGGTVEAVRSVLESVAWIHDDERGYDEHALNIEFQKRADQVHTLPCRYAAPESFDKMPAGARESYESRAGGSPIIIHRNREIGR